jgi:hypothetical protein
MDGLEDGVKFCATNTKTPLREASLILIDRTVDIVTPASYSRPSSPLLHHVLATINRLKTADGDASESVPLMDLDVQSQKLLPLLNKHDASNEIPFFTMSGLSSLPVQINPSLAAFSAYIDDSRHQSHGVSEDERREYGRIWRAFVSEPEETARRLLCDALRERINLERGTLPPVKKRGFGAELLAFVQSLITAPGTTDRCTQEPVETIQARGFNSMICERYVSLLSLVFCAIESLQRSSSKQFKMHDPVQGTWKACFDVSQAFDARMNEALAGVKQGGGSSSSFDAVIMAEIERRLQSSARSASREAKSKERESAEEPLDLANLMLTIAR